MKRKKRVNVKAFKREVSTIVSMRNLTNAKV